MLKVLFILAISFFSLSTFSNPVHPIPNANYQQKEYIVYITRTGEKYHRGSCRYLSQSKIEIKLKDAIKRGYGACKVCKP